MERQAAEVSTVLSGASTSPGTARRFVVDCLAAWSMVELGDTVELLTTELVTNVVLHVRADCVLRLRRLPIGVRVEVRDGSVDGPQRARHDAGAEGTTGRGLVLVEALASDWGVDADADGKTVWFEVSA